MNAKPVTQGTLTVTSTATLADDTTPDDTGAVTAAAVTDSYASGLNLTFKQGTVNNGIQNAP